MDQPKMSHGAYLQKVTERSREYLGEILKENERLRMQLAARDHEIQERVQAAEKVQSAEKENRNLHESVQILQDQVRALKKDNLGAMSDLLQSQAELARLEEQLTHVQTENRRFSDQFNFIEKQNVNLMNLYVTSYRLHGTLNRREVLEAIQETLINLVGSEDFAVFEVSADARSLVLASSFGIDEAAFRTVPLGQGILGEVAARGETFLAPRDGGPDDLPGGKKLLALVPLKLGNQLSGAIAIFSLLPQKNDLIEELDLEIFDLLATHASTALCLTRLHAQAGAKD